MFLMSHISAAEDKIEKKLDIVIPEVSFVNKDLESILNFIKVASRENDEKGEGLALIHRADAPNKKEKVKSINFYAKDIPVGTLVKYVCAQFNLKYKVEDFAVILGDSQAFATLETNFYTVSKGLLEFMNKIKYSDDKTDNKFQKYFKNMGISFPSGTRIKFVHKAMRLVVTNTPENHKKIAKYLKLAAS